MKSFIGKNTLYKILSIIKTELAKDRPIQDNSNDPPTMLFSSPQKRVETEVGKRYEVCSLNLPAGKWFLIGQTLASGNQIIEGIYWGHATRNNRKPEELERANTCFGLSEGGRKATLILQADGCSSTIHADGQYVFLVAIKISQ